MNSAILNEEISSILGSFCCKSLKSCPRLLVNLSARFSFLQMRFFGEFEKLRLHSYCSGCADAAPMSTSS